MEIIRRATAQDRNRFAAFRKRFAKRHHIEALMDLAPNAIEDWFDGLVPNAIPASAKTKQSYFAGVRRALDCKDATGISGQFVVSKE